MAMDTSNWTVVFSTTSPIEAEIVKQMLDSHSVEAVVMNQQDSSYQTFGEAMVYVNAGSEALARKLINELEL